MGRKPILKLSSHEGLRHRASDINNLSPRVSSSGTGQAKPPITCHKKLQTWFRLLNGNITLPVWFYVLRFNVFKVIVLLCIKCMYERIWHLHILKIKQKTVFPPLRLKQCHYCAPVIPSLSILLHLLQVWSATWDSYLCSQLAFFILWTHEDVLD